MKHCSENYDLSVIIPTVGRDELVVRAAYSVLSASGPITTQIVVVDDSLDGLSESLVHTLLEIKNLKIIKSDARNAGSARNLGVKQSAAAIISFLDDDDTLGALRLLEMYQCLQKRSNEISFVSTGRLLEKNSFHEFSLDPFENKFGLIKLEDLKEMNLIDIGIMCHRETFEEVGGFDPNLNGFEDWDLFIRMLKYRPAFKLERRDYFVNNISEPHRVSAKQEINREYLGQKHRELFGDLWCERMMFIANYHNNMSISIYQCLKLMKNEFAWWPISLFVKGRLKRYFKLD